MGKFVYSKGDEYCSTTFSGDREIALANGYKEVSDEMYEKLLNHFAHWVDGELVERQKTPEEIATAGLERPHQRAGRRTAGLFGGMKP